MPPIGQKFSYASDRPINDTVSDAIKYNEQMGLKYREEAEKKKAEIFSNYKNIEKAKILSNIMGSDHCPIEIILKDR